jgi:hypothetical protein
MILEDLFLDEEEYPTSIDARPPIDWLANGLVVIRKFVPEALIDRYCEAYEHLGLRNHDPSNVTPYMDVEELRDLCTHPDLSNLLGHLIGEPAGLHLNLIGWTSTERDWHQDSYLSPPSVDDFYAAVWIALEDIDPRSGPFQYIPGSHCWGTLDRDKVVEACGSSLSDPAWPRHSEKILTPLVEEYLERNGGEVVTYLPKKGDILVWSSKLFHRGSRPEAPGMERRALIAHYSGIHHRPDFLPAVPSGGGWVFPF